MSLVFSAIASHSPLLIPEIGKDNTLQLKKTVTAYDKLATALVQAQPDTIVIFSPHGLILPQAFVLNMSPQFLGKFEEFSDLHNKFELAGDLGLAAKIKQGLEAKVDLQIISEPNLDYGSAVPLFLLTKKLPQVKIIPIYNSQGDLQSHYNFGQLLTRQLELSKKKIAVIASADLSHCLSEQAPGGYSPKAKKFDQKVVKAVTNNQLDELLALDQELLTEVNEAGVRTMAMLLGVLSTKNQTAKLLSYEAPFGVGCLVVNYID